MNIKSLLLGSAAVLVAATGARAADAIVIAEPEPVEYVRVCDTYGSGYFYIPGTETCMRIHGYVRGAVYAGDDVYAMSLRGVEQDTYSWMTRAHTRFSTATETELGTLRTYIDARFQWADGRDSGSSGTIRNAWIELGGFRMGMASTAFETWTGGYGTVYNDDILTQSGKRTNFISYTLSADNGFSAMIGVEQGNRDSDADRNTAGDVIPFAYNARPTAGGGNPTASLSVHNSFLIDDYAPHVVGGVKYEQGWGGVSAVVAYDSVYEEWAGKVRVDVNATDDLSLFAMFGYKSGEDYGYVDTAYGVAGYNSVRNDWGVARANNTAYGDWSGDWIVWAGGQYRFNEDQTSFNLQLSYDDWENFAIVANVQHEIVSGLSLIAELNYVDWGNGYGYRAFTDGLGNNHAGVRSSLSDKDAFGGQIVLTRSF